MLIIPHRDGKHPQMTGLISNPDELLSALGEQLAAAGASYEIVVIGGAALIALGLISRATRDVDLVALVEERGLAPADPFPDALAAARDRVARDFGLPGDWLNPGPADLLRWGLPDGFLERVQTRRYGTALTVHLASRLDQIHFKLYAIVDQGGGKHEQDLRTLRPTRAELLAAAAWATTHDPSEGFRQELLAALAHFGVEDAELDA